MGKPSSPKKKAQPANPSDHGNHSERKCRDEDGISSKPQSPRKAKQSPSPSKFHSKPRSCSPKKTGHTSKSRIKSSPESPKRTGQTPKSKSEKGANVANRSRPVIKRKETPTNKVNVQLFGERNSKAKTGSDSKDKEHVGSAVKHNAKLKEPVQAKARSRSSSSKMKNNQDLKQATSHEETVSSQPRTKKGQVKKEKGNLKKEQCQQNKGKGRLKKEETESSSSESDSNVPLASEFVNSPSSPMAHAKPHIVLSRISGKKEHSDSEMRRSRTRERKERPSVSHKRASSEGPHEKGPQSSHKRSHSEGPNKKGAEGRGRRVSFSLCTKDENADSNDDDDEVGEIR